jgi:hypothetical protein
MDELLNFVKKYALYIVGGLILVGFTAFFLYEELNPVKKSQTVTYPNPSGISDSDFTYQDLSTATTHNDTNMEYPSDKYQRIVTEDGQVIYDPIMPFDSVDILGKDEFDRVIDAISPAFSESQLQQMTTPWIVRQFQDNFYGTFWPGDQDSCAGNRYCLKESDVRKGVFNTSCDR